ncbi:MAG: hypothetical protein ACFFF4_06655 [Candidatus Thorarchaeota archaeon]
MNKHDEFWEKEFAAIAAETEQEPKPRERRKISKIFFIVLSSYLIFLVVVSLLTRTFIEHGPLYWEPSILVQGVSFFAFFFVFTLGFYILETRDLHTEPVTS